MITSTQIKFLNLLFIGFAILLLNGCSIILKDDGYSGTEHTIGTLNQNSKISASKVVTPGSDTQPAMDYNRDTPVKKEIALIKKETWIPADKGDSTPTKKNRKKSNSKKKEIVKIGGLPVYGFVEKVFIGPKKLKFKAKLDSGAGTSSIHAVDTVEFERDGKKWVRFYMENPRTGEKIEFERKLKRYARVKEHKGDFQRRPVVLMDVKLGQTYIEREFTLADRNNFLYPVLLGRNFLSGIALIDVSRTFLAKTRPSDRKK